MCAFNDTGETFSNYMRTNIRTNTSPYPGRFPPMIYSVLASDPKDAIERPEAWIKLQHSRSTNGGTNMSNIVIAAHFGVCHDHVHLMRFGAC